MGFPVQTGSNDGSVRQSRGSPNGIRKCQLPQLTQRLIRGAHQAPFYARGLLKTGAVSENAPGAHRDVPRLGNVPHVGECPMLRRMFHAPAGVPRRCAISRAASPRRLHRPQQPQQPQSQQQPRSQPQQPPRPQQPQQPQQPHNFSNRSNGNISDHSSPSSHSDYSSEASSFIPSSILDLSRNEKLSLIVLRWLPSG